MRNVATEIGIPGEDIVPADEEMDSKEKQQQAMQAQAGAGGPPGAPHPGALRYQARPCPPVRAARRPRHPTRRLPAPPRKRKVVHPPAHPAQAGNQG